MRPASTVASGDQIPTGTCNDAAGSGGKPWCPAPTHRREARCRRLRSCASEAGDRRQPSRSTAPIEPSPGDPAVTVAWCTSLLVATAPARCLPWISRWTAQEAGMGAVGRRKGSLLVLAMLVALVGAGCGSDEPADSGGQAGGATVSGLVTDGTLTVATELPAPPFWIGKDYDSVTGGFEVELSREIAKRLNLGSVKFVEMPFAGLVAGQQCPCDINFSQVTITEERARVVDFTEPYFDANQGVLVKQGTKVASLADAKNLKWGAQINTTGARYIKDKIQPATEAQIYNTTVDAFTALSAGQIQAVMLDTPIVLGAVEEKQVPNGEVVGQFKTGEQYGAVLNKGSENLEAFNEVIRTLKSEGFVDQLFKKYFSEQAAVPVIE
jgi:polar amino acid transport system substrate-binding protein